MSNIVKVGETSAFSYDSVSVHVDLNDADYTKIKDQDDYVILLSEEQVVELRDLLNKVIEIRGN